MQTLVEHLRVMGEEKVKAFWQEAEAEVQRYTVAEETALAEEKRRCRMQREQALLELGRSLMREVEEKVWQRQSLVEARLAGRLHELATKELSWLREQCGSRLLTTLAGELPAAVVWEQVRVSEREVELARQLFPGAQVQGDRSIAAGLVAQSAHGKIMVVNTLEKRLERAWPQLLPEMLRALRRDGENAS
jgi:V/A-type H+-transporting ATPase subunit E